MSVNVFEMTGPVKTASLSVGSVISKQDYGRIRGRSEEGKLPVKNRSQDEARRASRARFMTLTYPTRLARRAYLASRALHVGGKNFTTMLRSIPSGGGRTCVTLANASRAD